MYKSEMHGSWVNSTSLLFIMSLKREIYLTRINYTKIIQIKSWIFFRKRSIVTIADDYTEKQNRLNDSWWFIGIGHNN